MNIKARIILGFLLAIVLISATTITLTVWQMREYADDSFRTLSKQQMKLLNEHLHGFIASAERNAAFLASSDVIYDHGDAFPNFAATTSNTVFDFSKLSEKALSGAKLLERVHNLNREYIEIYAGFPSGNFVTSADKSTVPAHFDTTKRGWYTATEHNSREAKLIDAYLSINGETVFAVAHKMRAPNGDFRGVIGIDVTLKGLSEMIGRMNFGQTGYFMLIEGSGRVLSDPKNPTNTGKLIGKDLNAKGLSEIFTATREELEVMLGKQNFRAEVMTTDFGWKIVALQTVEEIYAKSNAAIFNILVIVGVIAIVMILVGFFIVYTITKPLGILLTATDRIAGGDYSALPESRGFYGELVALYQSIRLMVQSIADNVNLAQEKTKEAEEKTRLAELATAKAEEAAKVAENAKREGMLAAATRLEGMVAGISAAAAELTTQIAQSDRGASESSKQLAEAAAAMQQMNANVQEVAQNASSAAQVSIETRNNAEEGQKILGNAVISIGQVYDVSMALKDDMGALYEHTRDISKIMNVISDIADQTNLLALNAAIEAARAGEAGRGFAVVADEVRKLAEKTMASTSDVSRAITAIQSSAQQSVNRMEEALQYVEKATSLANESGEALKSIVGHVENTADQVRTIATASEEQSASSEEITNSIAKVNEMSSQSTQAMSEAARAIGDLAKQTEKLGVLILEMKDH